MKKRYYISHVNDGAIEVEIDHDIMTEEKLHEINNFWTSADFRLACCKGNVLHAVLKNLAADVITENVSYTLNLTGVIRRFDYQDGQGVEGWPKMDGSDGITITNIETPSFDDDDMTVEEVE